MSSSTTVFDINSRLYYLFIMHSDLFDFDLRLQSNAMTLMVCPNFDECISPQCFNMISVVSIFCHILHVMQTVKISMHVTLECFG